MQHDMVSLRYDMRKDNGTQTMDPEPKRPQRKGNNVYF